MFLAGSDGGAKRRAAAPPAAVEAKKHNPTHEIQGRPVCDTRVSTADGVSGEQGDSIASRGEVECKFHLTCTLDRLRESSSA